MSEPLRVVIVGGCGRVGLPLGLVLATRGCDVDLLDIDVRRVQQVNAAEMPFSENGAAPLLQQVTGKSLRAT